MRRTTSTTTRGQRPGPTAQRCDPPLRQRYSTVHAARDARHRSISCSAVHAARDVRHCSGGKWQSCVDTLCRLATGDALTSCTTGYMHNHVGVATLRHWNPLAACCRRPAPQHERCAVRVAVQVYVTLAGWARVSVADVLYLQDHSARCPPPARQSPSVRGRSHRRGCGLTAR